MGLSTIGWVGTTSQAAFAAAIDPMVVNLPAGILVGDYLVCITYRGSNTAPDTPAGWTHEMNTSSAAGERVDVYTKTRVAETTVTFTVPGSPGPNEKFWVFASAYRGTPTGSWSAGNTSRDVSTGSLPTNYPTAGQVSGTLLGEANGVTDRLSFNVWVAYGDIYNTALNAPGSGFPVTSYPSGWDLDGEATDPDIPRSGAGSITCYNVGLQEKTTSSAFGADAALVDANHEKAQSVVLEGMRLLGPSWAGTPIWPGTPGPSGGGFFGYVLHLDDRAPTGGGQDVFYDSGSRKVSVQELPAQIRSLMDPRTHARAQQMNNDHMMSMIRAIAKQHNLTVDDIKSINDRVDNLESDAP
jgi:hypothetical protein